MNPLEVYLLWLGYVGALAFLYCVFAFTDEDDR